MKPISHLSSFANSAPVKSNPLPLHGGCCCTVLESERRIVTYASALVESGTCDRNTWDISTSYIGVPAVSDSDSCQTEPILPMEGPAKDHYVDFAEVRNVP